MEYEYLFAQRKKIGENIECLMRDRHCTKVKLSQGMKISRPTLDAFLRGDIHNAGKYDEYIKRLVKYMQITDSILDHYQELPSEKRYPAELERKDMIFSRICEEGITYIEEETQECARAKIQECIAQGKTVIALSSEIPNVCDLLAWGTTGEVKNVLYGVANFSKLDQLTKMLDCGASFVLCNYIYPQLATFCREREVLFAMGAMTLSEIWTSLELGADVIYLYPENEGLRELAQKEFPGYEILKK